MLETGSAPLEVQLFEGLAAKHASAVCWAKVTNQKDHFELEDYSPY